MSAQELLKALYQGKIDFCEKSYADDKQHQKLLENAMRLEEEVYTALRITEEQKRALEPVENAYTELSEYERMDMFVRGFRLGGQLAIAMLESQDPPSNE